MKLGIFIGRMQPLHIGHQKIIEKSLKENNLTFVILGSSNTLDEKNIFTNKQRGKFLKLFLAKKTKNKVLLLKDTISDKKWVENLNNIITSAGEEYLENTFKRLIGGKNINTHDIEFQEQNFNSQVEQITFYGGDIKNDYAIQIIKKFENLLNFGQIEYKEVNRGDIPISSTQIRNAIQKENINYLKKNLHPKIFKEIKNITLAK